MHRAVRACAQAGVSCLLVSLRGAALDGVDFYHAGLWSDLEVILRSKLLAGAQRRLLLGYSLGGHLALGLAAHRPKFVDACVAVCSPLDLDAGATALDTLRPAIYRRHVLDGLKEMYRATATTGAAPTSAAAVARVTTVRAFDSLTIVPRFGFDSVEDYYARASVGPLLPSLQAPCMYVQAVHDPMVPPRSTDPSLAAASSALTVVRVDRGGHVGFPSSFRLDAHDGPALSHAPSGLEAQCVAWLLARHAAARSP
jgi:predicted alpha/beta-fold hydrolase